MIILRQKSYSKASKMIKGALIAAPIVAGIGAHLGAKKGIKSAGEEEKREAGKRKIEENEKQIEANKKDLPRYKEIARKTREELGPEENWDDLDRVEMEMLEEDWKDISRENKALKEENKKLKSGNYESLLADDIPTGKKYLKRGAILGATSGLGIGAVAGHLIGKLKK